MNQDESSYFLRARRNLILMATFVIALWGGVLTFNSGTAFVGFPFTINIKTAWVYLWICLFNFYFLWRFSVSSQRQNLVETFFLDVKGKQMKFTQEDFKKFCARKFPSEEVDKDHKVRIINTIRPKTWYAREQIKIKAFFRGQNRTVFSRQIVFKPTIYATVKFKLKSIYKNLRSTETFSEAIFPGVWGLIGITLSSWMCLKAFTTNTSLAP